MVLIVFRWYYLGRGFTKENFVENADKCPYLSMEAIDPKWLPIIESGELAYSK